MAASSPADHAKSPHGNAGESQVRSRCRATLIGMRQKGVACVAVRMAVIGAVLGKEGLVDRRDLRAQAFQHGFEHVVAPDQQALFLKLAGV